MTRKQYHEKKLKEYLDEHAEKLVSDNDKSQAVIDYNVMMGNLQDPEQEENA